MRLMLAFFFLMSCSTIPKDETKVVRSPNRDLWVGKSMKSLDTHPIFSRLPVMSKRNSEKNEVRRYSNIDCDHVFYFKDKIIVDYKREGDCPKETLDMRPLDEEARPQYSNRELRQYQQICKKGSCQGIYKHLL